MTEAGPPGRRGSEVLDAIWDQVTAAPERPEAANQLFRAKALSQLDVAAEVDNQLPLVKRRSWLLLLGAGLLVAAFLLWASLTPSVTSVSAGGRVVAPPGALPVVATAAGIVATVTVAPGDTVSAGQPVATLRDSTGDVVVRAAVDGEVWQVLVTPGDAIPPGGDLLSVLPPDSDATALLALPEGSAASVQPGMSVSVVAGGQVTGTVAEVSAPLPATVAGQRTGLVLPNTTSYSLVTVALGAPLTPGASATGQVVLSDSSVINRLLGRT
jgi:biotin carboxyl carrier protein